MQEFEEVFETFSFFAFILTFLGFTLVFLKCSFYFNYFCVILYIFLTLVFNVDTFIFCYDLLKLDFFTFIFDQKISSLIFLVFFSFMFNVFFYFCRYFNKSFFILLLSLSFFVSGIWIPESYITLGVNIFFIVIYIYYMTYQNQKQLN